MCFVLSQTWFQTPALWLTCCVMLDKFPNLSGPSSPHLKHVGDESTCRNRFLWKTNFPHNVADGYVVTILSLLLHKATKVWYHLFIYIFALGKNLDLNTVKLDLCVILTFFSFCLYFLIFQQKTHVTWFEEIKVKYIPQRGAWVFLLDKHFGRGPFRNLWSQR